MTSTRLSELVARVEKAVWTAAVEAAGGAPDAVVLREKPECVWVHFAAAPEGAAFLDAAGAGGGWTAVLGGDLTADSWARWFAGETSGGVTEGADSAAVEEARTWLELAEVELEAEAAEAEETPEAARQIVWANEIPPGTVVVRRGLAPHVWLK